MIWHREDANGDEDFLDTGGAGDERWWHLTDTQFSTVAILDDGANLQERVKYDASSGGGKALHHRWRDPRKDGDRDYDSADRTIIINIAFGANNLIGQSGYRAEADLDRDGDVDTADLSIADTNYESALAPGVLSDSTVKNTIGWDGYVFNPETTQTGDGLYTVRFRTYSTELGRWLERDLAEYRDTMALYQAVRSNPLGYSDHLGLLAQPPYYMEDPDGRNSRAMPCQTFVCGPDVTDWFVREIAIYKMQVGKFRKQAVGYSLGSELVILRLIGPQIMYKASTFKTKNCPKGGACAGSVTLCGRCIHRSELGNMMFGIMGSHVDVYFWILMKGAKRANRNDVFTIQDENAITMGYMFDQFFYNIGKPFMNSRDLCNFMNTESRIANLMTKGVSPKCKPCSESVDRLKNHSKFWFINWGWRRSLVIVTPPVIE